MKIVLLAIVIAAVVFGIRWLKKTLRRSKREALPFTIPADASISTVPLLTEKESALYNLLQLVVQERYLVLAQVPLWSFIAVDAQDTARSNILRRIALKRVDFVLIHPGSCHAEYVVQIEEDSPEPAKAEGQRIIESVLIAAGIKLVKVQSKASYSLPDLAARLELHAEE
ncbi:MAG: DUF2726 domain-containing protein [Nitrospira sp.]|nr:DUF2726 domain-containing protein [Nitrospira sp.]MDH4369314.1 DUF2726 domain-containing protein [Nitrospira sp.]MDH5497710.1 DUF2726 domain-containing protein [Nitrospira sp.]MDH5726002.1 DUF2726 domain-containing protein [Nitrospira sp.]